MRTLGDLRWSAAPAAADASDAARAEEARKRFAAEVREHLLRTPRQLPTRYLYDELGSALFEAICELPWYRITRAEQRLLAGARDEIAQRIGAVGAIVELGTGSGNKLGTLLGAPALVALEPAVHLVDLSPTALQLAQRTLAPITGVPPVLHEATYEVGLAEAARSVDPGGRALVLFLGSNIGNFDPPDARAFLRSVRAELSEGDFLLLGADLVKPEAELLLAYADPLEVTAAFNKNLLVRVNRELGADFDLPRYAHRAVWNRSASRIEMHLVADSAQRVRVPAAELEIDLAAGESIWTESSYKYRPTDIDALLEAGGFRVSARWTDRPDAFALTLAEAV